MVEEGKYGASMAILQRYLTTDDNNGEERGGGGEMRERELHFLFLFNSLTSHYIVLIQYLEVREYIVINFCIIMGGF